MTEQIKASHILLMYAGSASSTAIRTKEDAKELILEFQKKISEGKKFEEIAHEYSDCPSSAQECDLGSFGRGQMVPEFEKAGFALEIGNVSEVVETPFGYHLIKRTG